MGQGSVEAGNFSLILCQQEATAVLVSVISPRIVAQLALELQDLLPLRRNLQFILCHQLLQVFFSNVFA